MMKNKYAIFWGLLISLLLIIYFSPILFKDFFIDQVGIANTISHKAFELSKAKSNEVLTEEFFDRHSNSKIRVGFKNRFSQEIQNKCEECVNNVSHYNVLVVYKFLNGVSIWSFNEKNELNYRGKIFFHKGF